MSDFDENINNSLDGSSDCYSSHNESHKSTISRSNSMLVTSVNKSGERITHLPYETGSIKSFDRSRGHGMIMPIEGEEDIFVHVSEIMSEYIPKVGDFVKFKIVPIPPKNSKNQAVDVHFINEDFTRQKWSENFRK